MRGDVGREGGGDKLGDLRLWGERRGGGWSSLARIERWESRAFFR